MKITKRWIEKYNPCSRAVEWFWKQKERDNIKVLKKLIAEDKLDWANWAIVKFMAELGTIRGYQMYVKYAVFAAKNVIDIFEKEYPDDKRPRQAIEAAKKCLKNPSKKNK